MHALTRSSPARAAPDISVVIPTCGRVDLLDRCLDALLRQQLDGRRFEIIIVDDRPHNNTRQLVAVWRASAAAGGPAIRYLANRGPHGAAAARNRGWRLARAAIIAFTDDDTVPAPGWLRHGLAAFGEHVDVLCGWVDAPLPLRPTDHERRRRQLLQGEFVLVNCFCRKQVLATLGGLDERFPHAWRDDSDLYFRLLALDARIARAPHAIVVHPLRHAGWGACLKEARKAAVDALLFKKHPTLYRKKIAPAPRWDELASVAGMLCTALGLALGSVVLAGAGAAPWLLLTVHSSARRLRGTSHALPHVAEVIITAVLLPPLAVFWRLAGALRYRVRFA